MVAALVEVGRVAVVSGKEDGESAVTVVAVLRRAVEMMEGLEKAVEESKAEKASPIDRKEVAEMAVKEREW